MGSLCTRYWPATPPPSIVACDSSLLPCNTVGEADANERESVSSWYTSGAVYIPHAPLPNTCVCAAASLLLLLLPGARTGAPLPSTSVRAAASFLLLLLLLLLLGERTGAPLPSTSVCAAVPLLLLLLLPGERMGATLCDLT